MEFEEYKQEEPEEDYVDIYSKRAIIGFSVFFNVLFGGAFLVINMYNAGYKKEIGRVISFSFFYYFLTMYLVALAGIRIDPKVLDLAAKGTQSPADTLRLLSVVVLTLSINFLGGFLLTRIFYNKYFPDNDYYPKPVGRAILICLLVSLIFSFVLKGLFRF
ncbi:hypothetical protein [Mucilaginibacter flavus]|uniref:hypothetical protein n=1 Tax=Mucilaginibacter flavus TaxID=931504 RepID=UPI0025B348A7|nr:hypothetical protein [Mucilaginibacter flavus]MDN3580383.1 hypothetical protein [Mucilaginibacter flavus]